ncbi:ANTAR domain-containing protein [Blastococcus montanus]|uniref:ANTAR domain-containing protein n=1 Tax=Blastococcus montanus TaxID=3144973 RepID=UPI003207D9D1
MVPGPRPSDEVDGSLSAAAVVRSAGLGVPAAGPRPQIALTRTPRGWVVVPLPGGPVDGDCVEGLVEGMTLADLVADEVGLSPEPDRNARRSARGRSPAPADTDCVDARIAALQHTVAQLEHALASRVSTERAIGVLAERHGSSLRAAFEGLRRDARTQGRAVVDLAREVLAGLAGEAGTAPLPDASPAVTTGDGAAPAPRALALTEGLVANADGRS